MQCAMWGQGRVVCNAPCGDKFMLGMHVSVCVCVCGCLCIGGCVCVGVSLCVCVCMCVLVVCSSGNSSITVVLY